MGFSRRLKYYLVHTLKMSNVEAQLLIDRRAIRIDQVTVDKNIFLDPNSEIEIQGKLVRASESFTYLKFYKPRGFESTLNGKIDNNLSVFFTAFKNLSIAGRLDKQSEGLLLLSNDGKWVEKIINPKFEKEKEYVVELDKQPDQEFIAAFAGGLALRGYTTKPCFCSIIEGHTIKVILKEGKNRQIRNMCKALGYSVLNLKRTKVDQFELLEMQPGDLKILNI